MSTGNEDHIKKSIENDKKNNHSTKKNPNDITKSKSKG